MSAAEKTPEAKKVKPPGLWVPALGFVLCGTLSPFFTLVLLGLGDPTSSSDRIGAAFLAVLCVLGWWGTFRSGRGIVRWLRRAWREASEAER